MLNPVLYFYHIQHRYFDILKGNKEFDRKRKIIEQIIPFAELILNDAPECCNLNKELALVCAEHIYDGYVAQSELLGSMDFKTAIPHSVFGLNYFNNWLTAKAIVSPIDEQIQIFRDVLLYHENPILCSSAASRPYVTFICSIERFVVAVKHMCNLSIIKKSDLKGFSRAYPNMNPRFVKPRYFEQYEKGELLYKQCTTYAEYTLITATLLTSCLKRFPYTTKLLEQPAFEFPTVLEGYNSVFKTTLMPSMAKKAYTVLLKF
jgi:hypothetical protein